MCKKENDISKELLEHTRIFHEDMKKLDNHPVMLSVAKNRSAEYEQIIKLQEEILKSDDNRLEKLEEISKILDKMLENMQRRMYNHK